MADREIIDTDMVIVGAGPAGLAAAIRLKQKRPETAITIVEKSAEIGGHILSGAVMDPVGPRPNSSPTGASAAPPSAQTSSRDVFHILTRRRDFRLPNFILPPLMKTHDGVITSLGDLVRWLGEQAQALGVDIYPMTAAVDVLTTIPTARSKASSPAISASIARANPSPATRPASAIRAKYTLIGEGARGSLAKRLIARFNLDAESSPQKYRPRHQGNMGDPDRTARARPRRSLPRLAARRCDLRRRLPLPRQRPPHLPRPRHPPRLPQPDALALRRVPALQAAPLRLRVCSQTRRASRYGARALTSGGWQSIPEQIFPGGALIGCAAGFMNAPRLKAIHSAIRSGIAAADSVAERCRSGRAHDRWRTFPREPSPPASGRELRRVRNVKPLWSRFGTVLGALLAGVDMWVNSLFRFSPFGTLRHSKADADSPLAGIGDRSVRTYRAPTGRRPSTGRRRSFSPTSPMTRTSRSTCG